MTVTMPYAANQVGTVYLVGAGPGDPELITVKGLRCLQTADVILYDRLVNPALLSYSQPHAHLEDVGKAPQRHRRSQEEINDLLISYAQQGRMVVRLKGGDPFVFGRGGEEAQALAAAGVPFVVVPGITSAVSVPAYAGIPVTQRHLAQSFTVVTGHSAYPDDPLGVDWQDLPQQGTLIILMGVRHLRQIMVLLQENGRAGTVPVAVIEQGSLPQQRVVIGTVADIADRVHDIRSPAITIVGDVVKLHDEIDWFQPLEINFELYKQTR